MKMQKHALKHCQEHAKPTGGDIISTVKPIRSLKKEITAHAPTSQAKISGFIIYSITKIEFLKIVTLPGVVKKVRFQWPGAACACGRMAKPHRTTCVFENTCIHVDRALNSNVLAEFTSNTPEPVNQGLQDY